jgi:cytochrome d ubiquinol oxidase subunit II
VTTVWFCLIAIMIVVYVVLDGFDLGAGIIHLGVAHTDAERRQVLATIGPVWDGNEVWLLASGGVLYFAFPALYAAAFSGFYLPLMIVLWLLVLRGISIEFRNHVEGPVWAPLWDVLFAFSSALLAIFYGAALGNVVRGVPLDASGYFFEPLWTNFRIGPANGILDWYTILVGLAAYFALTQHGALWVAAKTQQDAPVRLRALRLARFAWPATVLFTLLVSAATFWVQPHVLQSFSARPWGWVLALVAAGGLLCARLFAAKNDRRAFLASCAYLLGMLASVVFGVYPDVLPASGGPQYSLTIRNAAAGSYGLRVGLIWWVLGVALASGYFIFLYRMSSGRVPSDAREQTPQGQTPRGQTHG